MTRTGAKLPESQSLAAQIARTLQSEIMQGELSVSARLPTDLELAERFAVSQPTVREAMKILAAKKLIRSKRGPNGGVFVNAPSIEQAGQVLQDTTAWLVGLGRIELSEIVETRRLLGRICVELAAERASQKDLDRIARTLDAFGELEISDEEFCRLDVSFHHAVTAATRNAELQLIMLIVNDSLIPATNMISVHYRDRSRIYACHAAILDGLRRRDAGAAVDAFETLMTYLTQVYERALAEYERNAGGTRS